MWAGQDELMIDADNEKAVENLAKHLVLTETDLRAPQSVQVKESLPAAIEFVLGLSRFARA